MTNQPMSSEEMLPCPWCNKKPEGQERGTLTLHPEIWIRHECHIANYGFEMLPEQWNTRPSPWVKVSERLPETYRDVSVFVTVDGVYTGYLSSKEEWIVEGIPRRWVTHWMPLPEKPAQEPGRE